MAETGFGSTREAREYLGIIEKISKEVQKFQDITITLVTKDNVKTVEEMES